MVMIESGSSDAEGLAKMAGFTEERLKALGARVERIARPCAASAPTS